MKSFYEYFAINSAVSRLYRNAGILMTGNISSSLIGLVSLAVLTRALPLEQFGVYVLIVSLVNILDRLTSFQTWQALIHFGSQAVEKSDNTQLTSLFLFGWMLDVAGGLVGYIGAITVVMWFPEIFGLGEEALFLVAIAASALIFNWLSSPTAIMRIFNRFYAQAIYHNITAIVLLFFITLIWMLDIEDLLLYVSAFAVSRIVGQFVFIGLSVREAKIQGLWSSSQIDFKDMFEKSPRLWNFVFLTNLDGMVRVFRELDIFIVNFFMGSASVALYKVARSLTKVFGKLTSPLFQATYPEMARFCAQKKYSEMVRMMRHASLSLGSLAAVVWLIFALFGPYILPIIFNPSYMDAFLVSLACMAAMVVWAFAQSLSPAMMAFGKIKSLLLIHIFATIIYIIILLISVKHYSLLGAGVSLVVFYLLWSGATLIVFLKSLKEKK